MTPQEYTKIDYRTTFEAPREDFRDGVYTFKFYKQRVKVRVDRLVDERGRVSADALIESFEDGYYLYSRLDLTNAKECKQAAEMAGAKEALYPWLEMVDSVRVRTLRAYRAGNPFIVVADMEAPSETVEYLLRPDFLERGTSTLLFADGGSGKSYLATALAVTVASGQPLGGMVAAVGPAPVLYLDWESDDATFWRRCNALTSGAESAIPDGLIYRAMSGKLSNSIEEIKSYVDVNKVEMVVVDSAALAAGDSEASTDATQLIDTLRSMGTTSLVIAHVPEADASRPFGSAFWRNGPRSVWRLSRDEDGGEILTLDAENTKANNSALSPPIGWQLRFEDGGRLVRFQRCEPGLLDDADERLPLRVRIMDLLAEHGALWAMELADHLGLESHDARRKLRLALKRGAGTYFTRLETQGKTSRWGLLTHRENGNTNT